MQPQGGGEGRTMGGGSRGAGEGVGLKNEFVCEEGRFCPPTPVVCVCVCVAGPIRHTQRAANLHILPGASVCPNSSLLPLLSFLSLALCSNRSDWRVESRRGWGFVYKEQNPPP